MKARSTQCRTGRAMASLGYLHGGMIEISVIVRE
jgi:hypothetical protein